MAYGATINVTTNEECTNYFIVQYKKDFEAQYTTMQPNPTAPPFQILPLDAATNYNVRITRMCCNGQASQIATTNFTTGA